MSEITSCGIEDCKWNICGECEAEEVEIDYKSTAAGFIPVCTTFKEMEEE